MGDKEYPLMDTLKYWRFRMILMPQLKGDTRHFIDDVRVKPK